MNLRSRSFDNLILQQRQDLCDLRLACSQGPPDSVWFQQQESPPEKAPRCQDSSALELTLCIEAKKAWTRYALGHAKKPRAFSEFWGENIVFIGKFSFSVAFVIHFIYDWFIQAVGLRS